MKKRWLSSMLALLLCTALLATGCTQTPPEEGPTGTDTETVGMTDTETDSEGESESETDSDIGEDVKIKIGEVSLSQYTLVYGVNATATVKSVVRELNGYIEEVIGVELPVLTDADSAEYEIVIGTTNRDTAAVIAARNEVKHDGYALVQEGNRLFITGAMARGTVFGMYSFAEDYLGMRFYTSTSTVHREDGLNDVPVGLSEVFTPSIIERGPYYHDATAYADFALRTRASTSTGVNNFEDMKGGDYYYRGGAVHNLGPLSETGGPTNVQPCLSKQETFDTVLKNVCKDLDKNLALTIYSVSQNDNGTYCRCEDCAAFDEAHGSHMASLLNFVNRIAEAVDERYPDRDIKILTLAYTYSADPPTDLEARDNVIVQYCVMDGCFAHALNDASCVKNVNVARQLRRWSEICNHLYIWDYNVNFSGESGIGPDLDAQWDNFQLYKECNVVGFFGQMWTCESSEFGELRGYLNSQLQWNAGMTREEYQKLVDEFMEDYYGAAALYLKEYLDLCAENSRIANEENDPYMVGHTATYADWRCFYAPTGFDGKSDYTSIDKIVELWESAFAADLTEEQRAHVKQASIHFYDILSGCAKKNSDRGKYFREKDRLYKKYVYDPGEEVPVTVPKDDPGAESQGLTYFSNGDGTCYVIDIGSCKDAELVIPAVSPKGDRVIGIGEFAFARQYQLTSITIPEGVVTIGNQAFMSCTGVTKVIISDSVTEIGMYAFGGLPKLTELSLGQVQKIGAYAFCYATALTHVILPDSATHIGFGAFMGCSLLSTVTVGKGVTRVDPLTFQNCYRLVEVINLSSLRLTVGDQENGCLAAYALEVHDGTSRIVEQDGFRLYTVNGTRYVLGYVGTETRIALPAIGEETAYEIASYAFYGKSGITHVVIPAHVTRIGTAAFQGCRGLMDITFEGTVEQWNALEKGTDWNKTTGKYTVHCVDGDVAK